MRVDNEKLRAAVELTWTKFNAVPNLRIQMNMTAAALAEGTQENECGPSSDAEECFRLSNELAASYEAVDIHVYSDKIACIAAVTRSTQFPEIGEKEWTYNRMLETSLRDRGVTGRVVSLRLTALPEGVHVMKYIPITPLYAEETMFQLYGQELLPFDITKQNALYASLDLIGLNSHAGVGWVEILSISEAWHWKPIRGDVGVANVTIRTKRDRTGQSMGETLSMQLPRLLDRLDEIGLRRVDGEVLWSSPVTNQAPQDQIARHLPVDEPIRAYDDRQPLSLIPSYPLKRGSISLLSKAAGVIMTLAALAGGLFHIQHRRRPTALVPPPSPFAPTALGHLNVPTGNLSQNLRTIPSNPSPVLIGYNSVSPLAKPTVFADHSHSSHESYDSLGNSDTMNPFKKHAFWTPVVNLLIGCPIKANYLPKARHIIRNHFSATFIGCLDQAPLLDAKCLDLTGGSMLQRLKPSNADIDIKSVGDSATDGVAGVSEARRWANFQAELEKAHSLKGWEIPMSAITICQRENPDGSGTLINWKLGQGGFGEVYKGIKQGVTDVAVKVLTYTEELSIQQFLLEIELLRSLSFDNNIVQFLGCVKDAEVPMLVLELMEGGDLRSALSGPLAEMSWDGHGRVLAMDIVSGLFYLHDKRVIHGDLKSKNILLSRNWVTAKLSDVGMARFLHSTITSGERGGNPAGTFAYAAPELLLGQRCTLQADIFSLGVLLWEICTHEIPARGQMRPLQVPEDCPQSINNLIERCMVVKPEDRPTARDVFWELKAADPPTVLRSASSTSSAAFPTRLSVQRRLTE